MKKTYIIPKTVEVLIDETELIADSPNGGLNDGDNVGMQKALYDDENNFYVKGQNCWDNEW